ncbi:pyridoxal phosphate-dependent aminotransferase [Asaccharospora irregularis]|uniref:Threonine-phosphate decarboxylase n=1 Tax=Asaccharospora irregularis DSM 2635 TaxID=1121321 RepID=A0A1M5S182_9FIRM|nr:histidinol-phosphate transaminase [Asaccharospora irregularis]SHH32224.1 threonine-phosphate decarboxylase [Asaccharospora irregularis DSM 2635]
MKDLGHGANVESMAKKYGKNPQDIVDFSSNINSKLVNDLEDYILEGLKNCTKYPDINYWSLRNNISEYISVDPSFIIPGNGATEIIYLLMKSIGKKLAILNPTFSEYKRSADLNGLEIINLELDEKNNFTIDLDNINKNIDKFESLFICNPNNPNGKVQDIKPLMKLMIENNKLLIIDETFMEFVEHEKDYSLVGYVEEHKNIFILKAVTKFFGMPGLRLGYGVTSNKKIIDSIYRYKEPWTVNSFADTLSNYIFKDKKYIHDSKNYYIEERNYMIDQLRKIKNISVYETDANFILIKLHNTTSGQLKEKLFKESSILIRDASNFIGLDDRFIRVAIKSREYNELLIKNLRKLVGN